MCCLLFPFPQRRTQGFRGAGNTVRQLLNNRSQKEFVGQCIQKVFWGLTGLVEGATSIALEGSLSPFPGSVPAVTAEFLPRSTESSAWTQGNNLLWKGQSPNSLTLGMSHCDNGKALAGAEPRPPAWNQRCSLSATKRSHHPLSAITPSVTDQHWLYSKAWNSDSHAWGSRHFCLSQATLNPKHCGMRGAGGVLPSLQMVQHCIFK